MGASVLMVVGKRSDFTIRTALLVLTWVLVWSFGEDTDIFYESVQSVNCLW